MSTRSTISIQTSEDVIRTIYCHYDGYLDHVGAMLHTYYNTEEKVNALIDLGNLSSLDKNMTPEADAPHSFEHKQTGVVVAYHRDRGEALCIDRSVSIYEIGSQDYNYIFKDGAWYYWTNDTRKLQLLTF